MVYGERFTVSVFMDFLNRLVRQKDGRKVFLIVDRRSVHKARKVAKRLEGNHKKIQLFFLPAYSSEINPDELLNQDLKSNAFRQGRARDKAEMMTKTRAFLRGRQRRASM